MCSFTESIYTTIKIEEDDELPTSVCVKCIGALEFLCDFYDWCHRTQRSFLEKVKRNSVDSDSQFSTDESDKENVLPSRSPKRKLKTKVSSTETSKKVSEPEEVSESEIPKESPIVKETDIVPVSGKEASNCRKEVPVSGKEASNCRKEVPVSGKEASNCRKEVPVSGKEASNCRKEVLVSGKEASNCRKEVLVSGKEASNCRKEVPVSGKEASNCRKEVPVSSEKEDLNSSKKEVSTSPVKEIFNSTRKEVSVSFGKEVSNSSLKEVAVPSAKRSSHSFGKELFVSLRKEVFPVVKNSRDLKDSLSTEEISTSVSISTASNKEVLNEKGDSGTPISRLSADKKQEAESKKSSDNKTIVTPLTEWLKGSQMNKKRKRNGSPVQDNVNISRLSESKYSRISELMTDEQKEAIENYYRVDMSVVDEIKVADNMTIFSRNEIECKICKQKYNRMDKCQVHIWRHLDMKPYFCGACNFSTLTISNIRCHIRKSHLKIKPYGCHLCEKQYTSPTSLEEHLNTHTGAKPYRCNLCEFSSASKQVLSYHKLTHKSQKDVECDVCGKTFYSKGRLRTHKFIHNKDTAFKCKYCSTYFMQKEALEKHYNTAHVQDYLCNICSKSYKSKKALNNHQNVHSEAKYQCTMCPNRYKSHHILKEHILKHGGIRKYKCDTCQKTFAQQSHLAAHMSVHIGIRYECPGCKKGFNRHDNMKVHTKRCNEFLRNPALKELLTNKVKTKTESFSSADIAIDTMSISSRGSISSAKTSASSVKKVLTKVEPIMDSEDSTEDSDSQSIYLYSDEVDSRKKGKSLRSCTVSEDDDVISHGEISVTENILSPECF